MDPNEKAGKLDRGYSDYQLWKQTLMVKKDVSLDIFRDNLEDMLETRTMTYANDSPITSTGYGVVPQQVKPKEVPGENAK